MFKLGPGLALACGLIGATPAHADDAAACDAVADLLKIVAERYEPMKEGGSALMVSLARISMKSGPARVAADNAGWDADTVAVIENLQGSPATDGQGGFTPTAEASPDYVLDLARSLKDQAADKCAGTGFVDLPSQRAGIWE
jgi:hypothetical protein